MSLLEARMAADLTQAEVAQMVGAGGRDTYCRWELGNRRPRPQYLRRLRALFRSRRHTSGGSG